MSRFQQMQVFVAVAEESGFAAAARRLQLSAPAVTRSVAALEAALGVVLLKRTTRQVRLTEAGARYLEDARRILADVAAADAAVAGVNAAPRGRLSVTAPVLFGRLYVTPGVVEYLRRYPQMRVDTLFLDRVVNLLDEGLDVGVRIGELPDSGMRALRVGWVRVVLVASPGYLDERGEPDRPDSLIEHRLITTRAGDFSNNWRFGRPGREKSLRATPCLSTTTNDSAIAAAEQDLGITRVLSYQVAPLVGAGRLRYVLADWEPPAVPVHIVHREERSPPAKVRAFIDLLAERLRSDPALAHRPA